MKVLVPPELLRVDAVGVGHHGLDAGEAVRLPPEVVHAVGEHLMCVHICLYIYIYIYRERERER